MSEINEKHVNEAIYGTGKKTLSVYLVGIVLCVILTLIPFMVVMHDAALSDAAIFSIIYISAVLQFITQVICFLRLNAKSEQGKLNIHAFILAIFVLLVIVFGSLWIMWNLNYYMTH